MLTLKRFIMTMCLPLVALSLTLGFNQAFAATPINTLEKSGLFSYSPSGVAIRGTDTVAYFTEGKPIAGLDKYATEWQGATWKFSSQNHLDLFKANPEKYAPQYGGYCAYAVSRNTTASIKPEFFTVYREKLYLNFNKGVYKRFIKNKNKHIARADKNWPDVLN